MGTTLIHDRKSIADQERNRNTHIEIIKMLIIIRKRIGYQHFLIFYTSSSATSSKDTP